MNIFARIENLRYTTTVCRELQEFNLNDFLMGIPFRKSSFILKMGKKNYAISHWVSPKRTRSYPYSRVYDTMAHDKRVTIIPFVKDEGFDGDRDFVQWDTVSLMSLLGVYVILAYYNSAQKSKRYKNKIASQKYDYLYLKQRVKELNTYKSDALHWNINELNNQLIKVAKKSKENYATTSRKTKVKMHSEKGIDDRINEILEQVENFKNKSRALALEAQKREFVTTQPKESVLGTKAMITIENYLGGLYNLTVDEAVVMDKEIFLIEKKHSSKSILPSLGDIKDGFLKMMLFTNLTKLTINGKPLNFYPILGLTSNIFNGYCTNALNEKELNHVFAKTNIDNKNQQTLKKVFEEGKRNNFGIFLIGSKLETLKFQKKILEELKNK